ncbi:L-amino-acid oxidase [Aspergillus pseudoustus]|uniref:L-amino-acid oxidase n=1 Tax=Aspergillus pseudoustus TaxID=1810923 RepID=A0ABR4IUE0_9EURO
MYLPLCALAQVAVVYGAMATPKIGISIKDLADSNVANVYLDYPAAPLGKHAFTYGGCDSTSEADAYDPLAQVSAGTAPGSHSRLVWVVPEDVPPSGCISAWGTDGMLLGRSAAAFNLDQVHKTALGKRDRIAMNNDSGIDAEGPWFNGVELLRNKEIGLVDVKKAKSKSIGIIGGGISGLMTHFLLRSVGFTNLEISESTGRVGGRIWTEYFDPDPSKYQYQEMGAMRIPLTATFPLGNESLTLNFSNHEIVFHLAEELNKANKHESEWAINWIPFLQTSDNALSLIGEKRNADGSIPTIGDVAKNTSLGAEMIHTKVLDELRTKINEAEFDPEMMQLIADNIYEAHKRFMDIGLDGRGGDDWSQTGYVHNVLGYDLNTTDLAGELPSVAAPYWVNLYDNLFFSSKEWRTIDKGMSRLPNAFKPQIGKDLKYHRKIQRIDYLENENKVQVSWKDNYTDCHFQDKTYDYTFVAAPFTVVRKWKLPELSPTLANAIAGLNYQSACKMALEFHSRFWEHTPRPIYGSCNTVTDAPGIGDICYPGFNLNSTGPAVVLGSYNKDDYGERWVSTAEEEHAQYVLDSLVQLHGDAAREQYTGRFKRLCWLEEESNAGGSWALPSVGQHKLYIPAYFGTEKNMIFIGEHTSYTHSWIASALESAVRGSVQLLLELGLVDEAKQITREWMGRWITVWDSFTPVGAKLFQLLVDLKAWWFGDAVMERGVDIVF